MLTTGKHVNHRPDIVLQGVDGPGTHLLIDVKTFDAAADSHITRDATSRTRRRAHTAIADKSRRAEYGELPANMRLVIVVISTFGSLGGDALPFLSDLDLQAGESLPFALLDEASWAVPRFSTFARMALTCAVRRGLAQAIYDKWIRVDEIPGQPGVDDDGLPPGPPLLLEGPPGPSHDALLLLPPPPPGLCLPGALGPGSGPGAGLGLGLGPGVGSGVGAGAGAGVGVAPAAGPGVAMPAAPAGPPLPAFPPIAIPGGASHVAVATRLWG